MAVNGIVSVTTNAGKVPAVIIEQYDTNGDVTAVDNDVVDALLLVLGQDNAQRRLAKDNTVPYAVGTFTFTGANS